MLLRALFVLGFIASAVGISSAQSSAPAVFVANNVGDSITSMTVNPDGSLSYVGTYVSSETPQAIALSPDGRFLAVTHATISTTSEALRIFEVNSDASLTIVSNSLVPDSPLGIQWLDNQHMAITETSLSNANSVRTYLYDDTLNVVTPIDDENTGDFNTSLDVTDAGDFLFANSSLGSSAIYSFSIASGGQITPADVEFMSTGFAVDVEASRDGRFVYGAGGISEDDRRVYAFSVDATGVIDPLDTPSFTSPGQAPKDIALTADDSILVAGHGGDGTARTFLRDPVTGALAAAAGFFDAGGQGELGDLEVMGDLLFVSSESDRTVTSLRINPDGSLTQIGLPVASMGARPEALVAWEGLVSLICDFDSDDDCDIDDINLLLAEGPIDGGVAVTPGVNDQFDLDGDGFISLADRTEWLSLAGFENGFSSPYKVGDANLDGFVDGLDFIDWNENRFTSSLRWDFGDFNGDGFVDGRDFIEWNMTKFTSSDVAAVPEPSGVLLVALAFVVFSCQRKC